MSLDALDNNETRFWATIIAALRTVAPTVGEIALAMMQASQPPPFSTILTALLNDLASQVTASAPTMLILDDYHVIHNEAIHEDLTFLLDHLPEHVQIVLATRVDPDLPLGRWRVGRRMAEVRAVDLRFTDAEAMAFFAQTLGEVLAQRDVHQLAERTEGWIAGLQLAALALQQRTDRSTFVQMFTGSHRYLLDYVQEEILRHQPQSVQRFLLHSAVLRRMNAALCIRVVEEPASQALLERLERHNLFVVPLDDERQWYRLHDLFREMLLARLHATEPASVPQLHGRAARWYVEQGELQEAIAHALAASDFEYAAILMEREASSLWLAGEAQTVHGWVQALPDSAFRQHARFVLDAVLHLLHERRATIRALYASAQAQVEQTIARVDAVLQRQHELSERFEADEGEVALFQRRIRLLQALIVARRVLTRGDTAGLRLLAEKTATLSAHEEISWKLIGLGITIWLAESLQREGGLLIPQLLDAKQQVIATGDYVATSRVIRWLAFAYFRAHQLHMMHQECLEGLALTKQTGEYSPTAGYFHYGLALSFYAWNRLEDASVAVQDMLRIASIWQQADMLIMGKLCLAQITLVRGDHATAAQALQEAEALVQQERFEMHTGVVMAVRVQYWLAMRNLDAVQNWTEQAAFYPETWNPNDKWTFLMLIRVYLAQHQDMQALVALERFCAHLDRPGDVATTVEFLALYMIGLYRVGKREQLHTVAARLLGLTKPETHLRVFLNEGEPMRQVLRSLLDATRDTYVTFSPAFVTFISQLLACFEQAQDGSEVLRPSFSHPKAGSVEAAMFGQHTPLLTEPLTQREQEVLRLLVEGASNQDIANRLVISLATVKKHVSNLLGKLQAESRTQAIARAREWKLLP
jgi:LuxR family maltose regulon positive regulatory protein